MAKSRPTQLNVKRIISLYKAQPKGEKNVAAIAAKVGRSYTGVRRQLVLNKLIK